MRLAGAHAPDGPQFAEQRDVPWVWGCAILLGQPTLAQIGPFKGVRLKLEGAINALRDRPLPRARLGLDG